MIFVVVVVVSVHLLLMSAAVRAYYKNLLLVLLIAEAINWMLQVESSMHIYIHTHKHICNTHICLVESLSVAHMYRLCHLSCRWAPVLTHTHTNTWVCNMTFFLLAFHKRNERNERNRQRNILTHFCWGMLNGTASSSGMLLLASVHCINETVWNVTMRHVEVSFRWIAKMRISMLYVLFKHFFATHTHTHITYAYCWNVSLHTYAYIWYKYINMARVCVGIRATCHANGYVAVVLPLSKFVACSTYC